MHERERQESSAPVHERRWYKNGAVASHVRKKYVHEFDSRSNRQHPMTRPYQISTGPWETFVSCRKTRLGPRGGYASSPLLEAVEPTRARAPARLHAGATWRSHGGESSPRAIFNRGVAGGDGWKGLHCEDRGGLQSARLVPRNATNSALRKVVCSRLPRGITRPHQQEVQASGLYVCLHN